MTIVKGPAKRKMIIHGSGRSGNYSKIPMKINGQIGHGILSALGKSSSKAILGSLGKNVGSYGGKHIAKMIQDKTGSELLGKVAKSVLSNVGAFAGSKLGNTTGKLLGNTVFADKEKKKEKKENVSVSELMDRARQKLMGQQGNGINLIH